jgi:hypothetical protein
MLFSNPLLEGILCFLTKSLNFIFNLCIAGF